MEERNGCSARVNSERIYGQTSMMETVDGSYSDTLGSPTQTKSTTTQIATRRFDANTSVSLRLSETKAGGDFRVNRSSSFYRGPPVGICSPNAAAVCTDCSNT